jgi:GMP synthase (glutamine-hydrolysing)
LIADVLGSRVYAGPHKEIGWFPIERVEASASTSIGLAFPASIEAFHWHGDTYDLPRGAVHLARSEACENQAFVFEDRVLALQFHLETTPAAATALIDNCADELVEGPYIQAAESMLQDTSRFERINHAMWTILDQLATIEV